MGDNSKVYDGLDHIGETVYFSFSSYHFSNSDYWDEVNEYWRIDQDKEIHTGTPPISTSAPAEPAHADTP